MSNLLKKTMTLYNKDLISKKEFTPQLDQPRVRQLGENRYNIPAIKEWKNNSYSFNKTNLKILPSAKILTDKLIKGYFNLTSFYNVNSKKTSKRMRVVRKFSKQNRKSLRKIIVSEADIKHTNEKAFVNIYLLNKEKDSLLRKLYIMEKDKFNTIKKFINITFGLYNNSVNQIHKETINSESIKEDLTYNNIDQRSRFVHILSSKKNLNLMNHNKIRATRYLKKLGTKTTRKLNIRIKKRIGKINNLTKTSIYKSSIGSASKIKSLGFERFPFRDILIVSILRKKSFLKNLFFFSFLKWALWLLKIKVTIGNNNNTKLLIIKGKQTSFLSIGQKTFFKNLNYINQILLHLIITSLKVTETNIYTGSTNNSIFTSLFNYYKKDKLKLFLKRYLKKQIIKLSLLYSLSLNNFKLSYYLSGIENMLSKIFNKKIELNIVNIKYAHLNSDIFAQTISIKLKKKTSSLLRVLKRSLKLVKLPKTVLIKKNINKQSMFNESAFNNSFLKNYRTSRLSSILNISELSYINNKKDYLNNILNNVFKSTSYSDSIETNDLLTSDNIDANIISSIKNKWVKGVRIEAKGRLTKRYTASRSVFKYKYKGNLRAENTFADVIKKPKLSRGDVKSNMQYSLVSSKRRIGAFGIKGWISSS